jgi:hypothetical protein
VELRLHPLMRLHSVMPTVSRSATLPLRFLTSGDHYCVGICWAVCLCQSLYVTAPCYRTWEVPDLNLCLNSARTQTMDIRVFQPRNRRSIPGSGKIFFSSSKHAYRLWVPPSLLSISPVCSGCSSPGSKAIGV